MEQLEQRFAAEDTAKKEAELQKSEPKELRDMFKGVPPENVIIAVEDLPPETLEQPLKERRSGQVISKRRKKSR